MFRGWSLAGLDMEDVIISVTKSYTFMNEGLLIEGYKFQLGADG